jgi:hypothetical protein
VGSRTVRRSAIAGEKSKPVINPTLRVQPIFDTNIFGLGDKSALTDWRFLRQHRPQHGWPLSLITALELLASLDGLPPEKFSALRAQVRLAFDLSRGRLLDDPTRMLCREVLHIPFPTRLEAPARSVLRHYMEVVRCARTLAQVLKGVPYMGLHAHLGTTSAVMDLVNDLKRQWVSALEDIATAKNPAWRELFLHKGQRLPAEMRRELGPPSAWKTEERTFIEHLLRDLLDTTPELPLVDVMMNRFNAVLEFSTFVLREFLTGSYSIEKHSSDVFDQFQLRYLAMDRFVIVTNDADLSKRTARSPQRDRIVNLQRFLQTF